MQVLVTCKLVDCIPPSTERFIKKLLDQNLVVIHDAYGIGRPKNLEMVLVGTGTCFPDLASTHLLTSPT